jgi:uncharacterized lipoprotein YmbA
MLGALVALCGCALGTSARTNFYALSAEPDAVPRAFASAGPRPAPSDVAGLYVSIAQVTIPEIADRRQLIVRTSPNRVEISDFHQWAEPLKLGIARALAQDIAGELGPASVVLLGQSLGVAPDVRVFVDVQKFDAVAGHGVAVEAIWSVRPAKGEARSGRSSAEERAMTNDHAGIAAAYSRALARLGREIGAALAALQPN